MAAFGQTFQQMQNPRRRGLLAKAVQPLSPLENLSAPPQAQSGAPLFPQPPNWLQQAMTPPAQQNQLAVQNGMHTPLPMQPMMQGAALASLPQAPSPAPDLFSQIVGMNDPATWFQIAGGFLTPGVSWGEALANTGAALERQGERDFQNEERAYLKESRGWERDDRRYITDERRRRTDAYARMINDPNTPADVRNALIAGGPEALDEIMAGQIVTPFQQRQLGLEERGIDLQTRTLEQNIASDRAQLGLGYARLNQDRYLNSLTAGMGRDEAAYIAGMRQRLDNGNAVLPDLNELEEIATRNPAIFGALLEADMETAIRKLGRGNQRDITDIQRVWSIAASIARDELRGQTPISNLDLRVAMQTGPSTQTTADAARRWIAAARNDYTRMERQFQSALAYGQAHGGLATVNPSTGRNWYQDNYTAYGTQAGGNQQRRSAGPSVEDIDAEIARRRGDGNPSHVRSLPSLERAIETRNWDVVLQHMDQLEAAGDYGAPRTIRRQIPPSLQAEFQNARRERERRRRSVR